MGDTSTGAKHGNDFAQPIAMQQSAKHLALDSPAEETGPVPSQGALSVWSAYDWCNEVRLGQLSAFDRLVITTRNHTYEIIVTSPDTGEVLVRGGTVFPRFTSARLNGSTLGGSVIKVRSVNVGFRVEFAIENVPVVTSRVQTLAVVQA
jgi:hypothetical protein